MQELQITDTMKKIYFLLLIFAGLFMATGCYYDNEEYLYGNNTQPCDTSNVTYSAVVAPIMTANCNGCHSTASPSGNISTDNHTGLSTIALNGKLWGAVSHASGYSAMPKGGNKLTNCELAKIRIWIQAGAPNN